MPSTKPRISIIIPVHNRAGQLARCLKSIYSQGYKAFETLVIDDGSTEYLKSVINKYPVRYFYLEKNRGPAFARNFGVKKAKSPLVVFIDSDVLANSDFLERIEKAFQGDASLAAVQGTYTIEPHYPNFLSRFKNLTLCYHFSKNPRYANSIASFCTAVRKNVFLRHKGFDERIRNASIEDEEFGVQLTRNGHKILYDPGLRVCHMKHFTFMGLMKQDFRTGFAKIKSLLRKNNLFDRQELKGSHSNISLLVSIPLSGLIIAIGFVFFLAPSLLAALSFFVLLEVFTLLNLRYFRFLGARKKAFPLIPAFFVSILDYFSILLGILSGFLHYLSGKRY